MNIAEFTSSVVAETGKIILGKAEKTELILIALLSEGHVLLDDLPGVGKTTLVKTLSVVLGCESKRIQFVPDLMPNDILGMNIYDRGSGAFRLMKGPVFTNLLLADEINRAVPRTQAALLEAMEEQSVTIDGETLDLPSPFIVMATQNPVEAESTFRLPAAQMDRFMIKLSMGYPTAQEEKEMLLRLGDSIPFPQLKAVSSPEEIIRLRKEASAVSVSEAVMEYIVALTSASRSMPELVMGTSPRASRALFKASKVRAAMLGRSFVTPDDVKYLAPYVLTHRILLSSSARLSGKTPEKILKSIIESVPVPPGQKEIF